MVIIALICSVAIIVIDQILKYLTVENLASLSTVELIPNFLTLTYVENRGVAFGMFKDMKWIVITITSLVILFLIYILLTKKISSKLFVFGSALVIGGGIGNLIDRIFLGYVIDYLQLSFFPPVCNFADYCVTAGVIMIIIYILFLSDFSKSNNKNKVLKTND